jgi:hypothetical protein
MKKLLALLFFIPMLCSADTIILSFHPNGPDCQHVFFYTTDMTLIDVEPVAVIDDLFINPKLKKELSEDSKKIHPLTYQVRRALELQGITDSADLTMIKLQIEGLDFWFDRPSDVKGDGK